jgi:hypothetical protein
MVVPNASNVVIPPNASNVVIPPNASNDVIPPNVVIAPNASNVPSPSIGIEEVSSRKRRRISTKTGRILDSQMFEELRETKISQLVIKLGKHLTRKCNLEVEIKKLNVEITSFQELGILTKVEKSKLILEKKQKILGGILKSIEKVEEELRSLRTR